MPGIADNGDRCTDRASGLGDYTCQRCGAEDWREHVGTCGRRVLRDRHAAVLDGGTSYPDRNSSHSRHGERDESPA